MPSTKTSLFYCGFIIISTLYQEGSTFLLKSPSSTFHHPIKFQRRQFHSLGNRLGQERINKFRRRTSVSNYYYSASKLHRQTRSILNAANIKSSNESDNENKNNLRGVPVEDITDGEAWLDAIARGAPAILSNQQVWETLSSKITIQGETLRTCSLDNKVKRADVFVKTNGRPLHANVELWQGHTNCPQKMSVYLEDGNLRSLRVSIESPGSSNSVSIRNTAKTEYPIIAGLKPDYGGPTSTGNPSDVLIPICTPILIQGGAVHISPFPSTVQSVQVMLQSDGRPLNARVELLQGPNNIKQLMEIYSEDACQRTIYTIIDTPGDGNVVRIVNTNTVEYPLTACLEQHIVDEGNKQMTWN